MKKILIFIALKILEVSLVVFGPYYLGMWVHTWTGWFCEKHNATPPDCAPLWAIGFISLFFAAAGVFLVGVAIYLNWKWASKLSGKGK